jgi:hypothetical protein
MKKSIVFIGMLSVIGCKKTEEAPQQHDAACTECIIEGVIIDTKTERVQANKAIAVSLDEDKFFSADDPFVMTDTNGYFKVVYNVTDAKGSITLYPKQKDYNYSANLGIVSKIPLSKNYSLGKIYTNAYFP